MHLVGAGEGAQVRGRHRDPGLDRVRVGAGAVESREAGLVAGDRGGGGQGVVRVGGGTESDLVIRRERVVRVHGPLEAAQVIGDAVAAQRLPQKHVGRGVVDVVVEVGEERRVFGELHRGVVAQALELHAERKAVGIQSLVDLLDDRTEEHVVEHLGPGGSPGVEGDIVVAAVAGVGVQGAVSGMPHAGDEAPQPRGDGGAG